MSDSLTLFFVERAFLIKIGMANLDGTLFFEKTDLVKLGVRETGKLSTNLVDEDRLQLIVERLLEKPVTLGAETP